jgi:hypothetical protein
VLLRTVGYAARSAPACAFHGGCRIKPSRKGRGALAGRHARASMRDDLATGDMRVTDDMAVFETRP